MRVRMPLKWYAVNPLPCYDLGVLRLHTVPYQRAPHLLGERQRVLNERQDG
ncbi:MAG: hypothetical protein QOJ70_1255 [Acidobacteriota bacterium]|jgi:hypothetical protein|nr:hypothetical protein [Acidobacteriota bacterium]